MKKEEFKGLYNNDYSPRYCEPYNIYDKAKQHMKKTKISKVHNENSQLETKKLRTKGINQ